MTDAVVLLHSNKWSVGSQILKEAGPDGAYQDYIIEQLARRGVKVWDEARIAKGSLASTCGHDPAFVRIGVGTFALRAVTHHPEVRVSKQRKSSLLCYRVGEAAWCVALVLSVPRQARFLVSSTSRAKQTTSADKQTLHDDVPSLDPTTCGVSHLEQAASKSAAAAARAAQALADLQARETAVLERAQGVGAAVGPPPERNNFQCTRCRKVHPQCSNLAAYGHRQLLSITSNPHMRFVRQSGSWSRTAPDYMQSRLCDAVCPF